MGNIYPLLHLRYTLGGYLPWLRDNDPDRLLLLGAVLQDKLGDLQLVRSDK